MTRSFYRAARIAALHSGAALAALASAPAHAAEPAEAAEAAGADGGGEAIVVTARRREEKAQDVPIALSVVSADTLEKTGNYTLTQIQQQVRACRSPPPTRATARSPSAGSARIARSRSTGSSTASASTSTGSITGGPGSRSST